MEYGEMKVNKTNDSKIEQINKFLNQIISSANPSDSITEEFQFKITQLCIMY